MPLVKSCGLRYDSIGYIDNNDTLHKENKYGKEKENI